MSSGWKGPDAAQQSGTVQVGTVVDFLCDADDQVIAELDRKITNLESQLAKLKRVKRMLAPRQTTGQRRTMQPSAEGEAQIAKICGVLKSQGPLRAKELAAAIGEPSYARVGKLCAASDKIRKRDDGRLELSK